MMCAKAPITRQGAPPNLADRFRAAFSASSPVVLTNGPGGTVWVAAARGAGDTLTLVIPELKARATFRLSVPGAPAVRHDVQGIPLPPWALYSGAVGWAWAAEGHAVPGLEAVVQTERGVKAGFVWELGLAFAAAWQDIGGWPQPEGGLLGLMTRLGGFFHS